MTIVAHGEVGAGGYALRLHEKPGRPTVPLHASGLGKAILVLSNSGLAAAMLSGCCAS